MTARVDLTVYGLAISVTGDWPAVVDAIRLDFAWFAQEQPCSNPDVQVLMRQRPADLDGFGDLTASFVTPRNTVYRTESQTVVDHIGRAISIVARDGNELRIDGDDAAVVHDAVYYFLLGRIGEHLDALHLPRLHALGLVGAQGAVAVLLPPGGGKSTLALHALRADGVRLVSDDSPLLDRRGRLHPFPLRLAINASDAEPIGDGLPAGRRIERFWLSPKIAIEIADFADRVAQEPERLRHLVIGRRSLAREPRLTRLDRRKAIGPLIREGVLGVGLYQGLGYAHQLGLSAVAGRLRSAGGRSVSCASALAGAQVWELVLSREPARNWAALERLLR